MSRIDPRVNFTEQGFAQELRQMRRDIDNLQRRAVEGVSPNATPLPANGARVVRTSNQSIPNITDTDISFDTVTFDDDGWWDAGSPTRLTAPVEGRFIVQASCTIAPNTTGSRALKIFHRDVSAGTTATVAVLEIAPAGGGSHTALNVSAVIDVEVSDFVRAAVYQASGGNLNVVAFSGTPNLSIVRLGSTPGS